MTMANHQAHRSIKRRLGRVCDMLAVWGIEPRKTFHALRGLPYYIRDLRSLKRQQKAMSLPFRFGEFYPCLSDRTLESGTARGHYFHQDLLVARKICARKPLRHIDVGSRIDGFVAHVASFREIEVLDIRPPPGQIQNVRFIQADLMESLPDPLLESTDSLSCLHVLEHFGLGRYGDPVRCDGYLKGLSNLQGILRPGGTLYLSVPIGPQRIVFNAHRVFSVQHVLELCSAGFEMQSFSYVDEAGDLHEDVQLLEEPVRDNYGCWFGCGIFEMRKR